MVFRFFDMFDVYGLRFYTSLLKSHLKIIHYIYIFDFRGRFIFKNKNFNRKKISFLFEYIATVRVSEKFAR